jgi:alpha-D-ribose 1-methylphosphonate 5-triphosphate diphosphatase
MTTELVLTNARIVLPDAVIYGSLQVRDGVIFDIAAGPTAYGGDMEGDFLLPGLVELHTDHIENHYAPRPRVRWNAAAAVQAHDAQIAASGITTVFDALRVGTDEEAELGIADMRLLSAALEAGIADNRLRADHFIHLRCEVSAPDCHEGFLQFAENPRVRLASLMDHAPGQRQFASLDAYKVYYMGRNKMTEAEFALFCDRRVAESNTYSPAHRAALSRLCHEHGIPIASHDDATAAHVAESVGLGVRIAEFPTTLIAAQASRDAGLAILMGAPNVVRGGSHSGNVSAASLAAHGLLDVLSSDYIPFSLLQAAFHLADTGAMTLPRAVSLVASQPAEIIGLSDRGSIVAGRRADLVQVRSADVPIVRRVWRQGSRVA